MADPLRGVGPSVAGIGPAGTRRAEISHPGSPPGIDFNELLLKSLDQVNQLDAQSQTAIATGLAGTSELTQAEILMSVKKADLALRTMLQIRNKVLEAYNEIKQMRM